MCLEGKWNWRPAGDHDVCWVLNSKLSKEGQLETLLGGIGEGWIRLQRLDLDILYGYIIDQSEVRVGSECILNAINPNASKKPQCSLSESGESLAWFACATYPIGWSSPLVTRGWV
jgi:hypothetical protein